MDFGEKGEAIIFGNKVKELYIQEIINIINLKLWNENCDKNPYYIGKKFLELNKETTGKITIDDLKNINEFTELLYEIINKDSDASPFILDSTLVFFSLEEKLWIWIVMMIRLLMNLILKVNLLLLFSLVECVQMPVDIIIHKLISVKLIFR